MKVPSDKFLSFLNSLWRPITGAVVGVNTFVFPWIFIYMEIQGDFEDKASWFAFYGAMCAYFLSLAGFRRSDKHKHADVYRDIAVARMGFDPNSDDYEHDVEYEDHYEHEDEPEYRPSRPRVRRKKRLKPDFSQDDVTYPSEHDVFTSQYE